MNKMGQLLYKKRAAKFEKHRIFTKRVILNDSSNFIAVS